MTISADSTQAREAARHSDGTFGEQHLPEPAGLASGSVNPDMEAFVAEALHDIASTYASDINNSGATEQVQFLHGMGVPAATIADALRTGDEMALDDLVHDAASQMASDVVNGGGNLQTLLARRLEPGTYRGKTAEEWREEASSRYRASADSWERSDTDGALTQWAADTQGRRYDANAALAEHHGRWTFQGLVDADTGSVLPARLVGTQYGMAFAVDQPDGGTKWVSLSQAKNSTRRGNHYAKHGVKLVYVNGPAVVRMTDDLQPHPYYAPDTRSDEPIYVVADDHDDDRDLVHLY